MLGWTTGAPLRATSLPRLTRQFSTVHRGTAFENRGLRLLEDNFSMSLRRVGGRDDGGIDLTGWWWLPLTTTTRGDTDVVTNPSGSSAKRRRIRVIAQCKAEKKKMGPNYVRELEGVVYRLKYAQGTAPLEPDALESGDEDALGNKDALVALLVSQSPFTKATTIRALSSPLPFFLLHLPPTDPQNLTSVLGNSEHAPPHGAVGAAVWNNALASGLLNNQIDLRWERGLDGREVPGMWFQNHRVENWAPPSRTPPSLP